MKKLKLVLGYWDYTCGDGCCYMSGVSLSLNGKMCDNQHAGEDVRVALEFVLKELGYEVEIE